MTQDSVQYKHVNIPRELGPLIPYMNDVESYREELHTLVSQWDLLTILGQMAGTGSDMASTQREFQSLSSDLLGHLGLETLKKEVQRLSSAAQVAVDILIRNLFERTADIGFLATDEDIRQFVMESRNAEIAPERKAALIDRFREYVAKYSVYYNIVLMDTEGHVLAQLDQSSSVERSEDGLIDEALETDREFVEIFRHTDLCPAEDKSLVYAFRVTESNDADSAPLGVLCLCFRFDNEMEGIFSNLISPEDWEVISILDEGGRVLSSSDPYQIPLGAKLETVLEKEYKIVRFAGRQYLAKTCATKGYQGFFGLGWHGHAMLPLEHAFESGLQNSLASRIDLRVLEAVMKDPRLFSQELRNIPIKADAIQKDLDRTVWNGSVQQNTNQSKVLLRNISAAGERTKQVFESSIGNLHETVVSAILDDVAFQAALAVDIMDRNLYERANDCRWWSLTSDFRSILSLDTVTEEDAQKMGAILKYINDLYTVYTNLFVYDIHGEILAISNPAESQLVGKVLKAEWVKSTLALTDNQAYSVSAFEKSHLYDNKHTYIYGASITAPEGNTVVGGIGIVFDSYPQFKAMLLDSLPNDEKGMVREGVFAVFCDRDQRIISASTDDLKPGEILDIDADFFRVPNGQGESRIVLYKGSYYAVGSRTSSGYREYKTKDYYTNDVISLVFFPLASATTTAQEQQGAHTSYKYVSVESGEEDAVDVAIVGIGDRIYGFKTSSVHRAISTEGLTSIPGSHELLRGKIVDEEHAIPVIDFVVLSGWEKQPISPEAQIVVLKGEAGRYGIIVDRLGPIPSLAKSQIDFNTTLLDHADKYTEGVILPPDAKDHTQMVVLLDATRLQQYLIEVGTFDS